MEKIYLNLSNNIICYYILIIYNLISILLSALALVKIKKRNCPCLSFIFALLILNLLIKSCIDGLKLLELNKDINFLKFLNLIWLYISFGISLIHISIQIRLFEKSENNYEKSNCNIITKLLLIITYSLSFSISFILMNFKLMRYEYIVAILIGIIFGIFGISLILSCIIIYNIGKSETQYERTILYHNRINTYLLLSIICVYSLYATLYFYSLSDLIEIILFTICYLLSAIILYLTVIKSDN